MAQHAAAVGVAVRDQLAQAGLSAVFFTGAESPKLRERAIVDFTMIRAWR